MKKITGDKKAATESAQKAATESAKKAAMKFAQKAATKFAKKAAAKSAQKAATESAQKAATKLVNLPLAESTESSSAAKKRAAAVRILFLDVDGTLTDGRLLLSGDGQILRAYHSLDGYGIRRFMQTGRPVAVITGAAGDGVLERMRQLEVRRVYLEITDKLAVMKKVLAEENLSPQSAAFVGDDIPDLAAMRYAGFAAAPPTAAAEVLATAHYVTTRAAGFGAVREVCDFILRCNRAKN